MKKILLLIVCFILIDKWAQAQEQEQNFAPIGAEWYYGAKNYYNYPHYSVFHVEKDTLFAGINCRKITGAYVPQSGVARALDNIYVYSTRDTVFYYNKSFEQFTPLYIFNVEEGDTIAYNSPYFEYLPHFDNRPNTPQADSVAKFTIEKIDFLNVDGKNLKRIWIEQVLGNNPWNYGHGNYIERIGSPFLIIPHLPNAYIPENFEISLRCYTDQEISYQFTLPCDTLFQEQANIISRESSNGKMLVYPNPSSGNFVIRMATVSNRFVSVTIVDIVGRPIATIVIHPGQQEVSFNQYLFAGIYILKYCIDDEMFSQKIVIH